MALHKFVVVLAWLSSILLCNGHRHLFSLNSLFIYGFSRGKSEKVLSAVPDFDSDSYARELEKSGAVYRTFHAHQFDAGKLKDSDESLFRRWVMLLTKKTEVTPSIFNMLDAFVHDNMPMPLASSVTRKLPLIRLDSLRTAHFRVVLKLFNKVMSRPPLSFDQLFRHIRGIATTNFNVVKHPSPALESMLQYLEDWLSEIPKTAVPHLLRYLGSMGLRFRSISESLGISLLHHLVRFSDEFTGLDACLAMSGLGQMYFDFPHADRYVKEAVLMLVNKAFQEQSVDDPFLASNLRALMFGLKQSDLFYSELSPEVKDTLFRFIDEKVPHMDLSTRIFVFHGLAGIRVPWSALSASNQQVIEQTLLDGLRMQDVDEKGIIVRAMATMNITLPMLSSAEVQEVVRATIYEADKKIVGHLFEVMPALNVEWPSIPVDTQNLLLDRLTVSVKFFSARKVIGCLQGMKALGLNKDNVPTALVEAIQPVLQLQIDRVRFALGDDRSLLNTFGITLQEGSAATAPAADGATAAGAADGGVDLLDEEEDSRYGQIVDFTQGEEQEV